MYTIKTYLGMSPIQGIGVFAGEDVAEGAIVWRMVPGFDMIFDPAQVKNLPPQAQAHLERHAYLFQGELILCADHGQFTNHNGDTPNTGSKGDQYVEYALRPIRKGDEITSDYRTFCELSRESLGFDEK